MAKRFPSVSTLLCFALLLLLTGPANARKQNTEITVSAASSLTDVMRDLQTAFVKNNPRAVVRFNFGASGALQQQIMQGAPVDVFVSASPKEMDSLQKGGHLETTTRVNVAGNRLVLIAPQGRSLRDWSDLAKSAVQRIALSNPTSVPSGRYAQETLTRRGLWNAVQPKAVFGENVRQTLTYVRNGDVDAGIVFATDARSAGGKVRVVQEALPGRDHEPIVYPAAVVAHSGQSVLARRFVLFLKSADAQRVFVRYGFTPAPRAPVHSGSAHP